MLFWIWLRPRYKIPELFTIAPVLTSTLTVCRRNRGDPSSLYRIYGALQVLQKNIVAVVWPGAAHAFLYGLIERRSQRWIMAW